MHGARHLLHILVVAIIGSGELSAVGANIASNYRCFVAVEVYLHVIVMEGKGETVTLVHVHINMRTHMLSGEWPSFLSIV